MFRPRISKLATGAITCAVLAAGSAAAAGPLHRFALIETRPALLTVVAAMGLALLAVVLGLMGLRATAGFDGARGRPRAVLAVLLALPVLAIPAPHVWAAFHAPSIHDITTDPDDPPGFEALADEREAAPNAVAHPGESAAAAQAAAYPEVRARVYRSGDDGPEALRERVFDAVETTAGARGWNVRERAPEEGRLEAVAVTRWFGFVDDVVVRVRAQDGTVRVDVRSASRVGESDLGANARRIRGYLDALDEALAGIEVHERPAAAPD